MLVVVSVVFSEDIQDLQVILVNVLLHLLEDKVRPVMWLRLDLC
jgi:hypothetical protein